MKKIFVVGSINTDLVIHAPYLPERGETLTGDSFMIAHGGKGANQAVAAARLGGDVLFCACVGDDVFGREAIDSLAREGIDVRNVRVRKGTPTGTAVIVVVDGDNRIILDKGANAYLEERDVDEALKSASSGDILLVQLENPINVIGHALQVGREKGMLTVLNPAPANREIEPYLSRCDIVVPNETEAEILGGRRELSERVQRLLVTVGAEGFELYEKQRVEKVPCVRVKAVDTTAAGDTFLGGLCAKLSQGAELLSAAKFGGAAASLACTRRGAQPSIPTTSETEKFLKEFGIQP